MIVPSGSSSKSCWIYNRTKRAGIQYKNDINIPRNVHRLNSKFDIGYIRKYKETKENKPLSNAQQSCTNQPLKQPQAFLL